MCNLMQMTFLWSSILIVLKYTGTYTYIHNYKGMSQHGLFKNVFKKISTQVQTIYF